MKNKLLFFLCLALCLTGSSVFAQPTGQGQPALNPAFAHTGDIARDGFPYLTAEGFLPEGREEYVFSDDEAGLWRYASQTLRIVIRRTQSAQPGKKLRYLTAEIFVRQGEDGFRMVAHDPSHLMENRDLYKAKPAQIARSNSLVFSMDGDYYIYRVLRRINAGPHYPVGLVIRGGQLLMETPPRQGSSAYPPLDHLALFPGGKMQVFKANALTGAQLIGMGARDVLSFGPVLVEDGKLGSFDPLKGATAQPRSGIGMFSPGHYLAIVVEGRIKLSAGISCAEFAELFLSYGCPLAFNLDGGWTSAMVFMGKQLNQLDNKGVKDNARTQNEVMGIGFTDYFEKQGISDAKK